MAGAEIRGEIFGVAIETTPGVAMANPQRLFPFRSLLTPTEEFDEPDVSTGSYERLEDSTRIYEASEVDGDGPADTLTFPYFMAGTMDGAIAPTTPPGGTLSRLWQAVPTAVGFNHKTFTIWTGDPNHQLFRAPYGVCTGWELASGEGRGDGSTFSASFFAQAMEAVVGGVSVPMKVRARKMRPLWMEAWLDNITQGGTIGGTRVTTHGGIRGKIISAVHTLDLEREQKQLPAGPGSNMSFSDVGRGAQQLNTRCRFHFTDLSVWNQWKADDLVALRVRHNGDLIEGQLRHYIEIDNYGKWRDFGWGEFATTNRAMEVTLRGLKNDTINASFAARCQTTLSGF